MIPRGSLPDRVTKTVLSVDQKARIDVELAKNWIRALRDPKRKQARSLLQRKRPDGKKGQCCLGVACEIDGMVTAPFDSKIDQYQGRKPVGAEVFVATDNDKERYTTMPPMELRYRLGISDITNIFAQLNDGNRMPFGKIADLYENFLIKNKVLDGPVE